MLSLREMQQEFVQSVFGREPPLGIRSIAGEKPDAADRLAIYRNNVFSNLSEALRDVYPVVEKLVGEAFFRSAADRFIRLYPSASGDLHRFGESFAEFLADDRAAAELIYLPDIARLEWLIHESFHAADHPPLELSRLAQLTEAQCRLLVFALHPACRLFASPYPVQRIWQVNQPDYSGENKVDLAEGGVNLLICRNDFIVQLMPVTPGEFVVLSCIARGGHFAAAGETVVKTEPQFDAGTFLQKFILCGALVDFQISNF